MGHSGWRLWLFGGVLLLSALLFFLPVGRRVFYVSDEARFGILAQDILSEGRWILPRIRGEVYLNKPPLYFWTIALFSLPNGSVTEFTAQLPSAIAALLGVVGVGLIGQRLWGGSAGIVAALILATSAEYFYTAHLVLPDMMLTAWVIWTLFCLLRALDSWPSGRWLIGMYLCMAGALATKGPVGLLPLIPALALFAIERGWPGLSLRKHLPGLLILGASVLPWLLPYLFQKEVSYSQAVIKGDYLNWFFGDAPSSGSRLFPLVSLVVGFLPWTPFLLASFFEAGSPSEASRRGRRRLVIWSLFLFVIIGLSAAQRTKYLLPVYPGLALLTAEAFTRWSQDQRTTRLRWGAVAWGGLALAGGVLLLSGLLPPVRSEVWVLLPTTSSERWLTALFLLLGGGGALLAIFLHRQRTALPLVGLSTAAALVLAAVSYPSRQSATFNIKEFTARVAPHLGPDGSVAFYRYSNLSFDFYLKRPLKEFQETEQALAFMARPSPSFLLMEDDEWRALHPRAPATWQVIAEASIANRTLLFIGNQS